MPPSDRKRPNHDDQVASTLEHLRQYVPDLDTRPGSVVRTLIDAAVRETERVLFPDPGFGTPPSLGIPDLLRRPQIRTAPPIRGRTTHAVMIDDESFRPMTPADLERVRLRAERRNPQSHMLLDEQTWRDIVGYDPSTTTDEQRERWSQANFARARQEIMAEEDRRIFEALDRIAADEGTFAATPPVTTPPDHASVFAREYMGQWPIDQTWLDNNLPPAADHPTWMMHEEPGEAVVNPRAVDRVSVPWLPIESTPTVSLEDIRERRFTSRQKPVSHEPSREMSLDEMKRLALIVRRTSWQHLLGVDDLEFP